MFLNKGFHWFSLGISCTNEKCALFNIHKISFTSSYLGSYNPASLS